MKRINSLVIVIFILSLFLFETKQSRAQQDYDDGIGLSLGHYYNVFTTQQTYDDAIAFCKNHGGYLATISNQAENDYIYQLIQDKGYSSAYFGYRETAGAWSWVNGEFSAYTNWAPGEPSSSSEHYAMFYWQFPDGTWNDGDFQGDLTDEDDVSFICEWDSATQFKSYKITYKLNGGTNHKSNPTTYTPPYSITLKNPTRKGYKFLGWFLNNKKITQIPMDTFGNITLTAKWEIINYKITYKMNGGKNNSNNPSSYTVTTDTFTLKNPTRAGFTFDGWYKFPVTKYNTIEKGSTGAMTLEARWKPTSRSGSSATGTSIKAKVSGWYRDGASEKNILYTTLYDDAFFTVGKSTILNEDLAKISMLAAASAYYPSHAYALLNNCGFFQKNFPNEVTKADNDHVSAVVGVRKTGDTTIVAIWVKGTSKNYEWVSNFNLGKNGKHHAGFKIAKDELWSQVKAYLKEQGVLNSNYNAVGKIKFWLTGHSRGAAVANMLAKDLTDKYGKDRVYAYTFATPRVTVDAKNTAAVYNNIRNYLNPGDFVTELAPKDWGFYRYGKDITLNANSKAAMETSFKKNTGQAYQGYDSNGKLKLLGQFLVYSGDDVTSFYTKRIICVDPEHYKNNYYSKSGECAPGYVTASVVSPKNFFQNGLGLFLASNNKEDSNKGKDYLISVAAKDPNARNVLLKLYIDGVIHPSFAHAHTQAGYLYWLDAMYQ